MLPLLYDYLPAATVFVPSQPAKYKVVASGTSEKLSLIEDRGQTDRVTTPTRAALRHWHGPHHAARLAALVRS